MLRVVDMPCSHHTNNQGVSVSAPLVHELGGGHLQVRFGVFDDLLASQGNSRTTVIRPSLGVKTASLGFEDAFLVSKCHIRVLNQASAPMEVATERTEGQQGMHFWLGQKLSG